MSEFKFNRNFYMYITRFKIDGKALYQTSFDANLCDDVALLTATEYQTKHKEILECIKQYCELIENDGESLKKTLDWVGNVDLSLSGIFNTDIWRK